MSSPLVFATLLAGCTHGSPLEDGSFGTSEQAIINGEPDVTHDAVVAVLGNNSACTGTIIAKDVASKKGFVLTAAHCVPSGPEIIVRGTNYQNGTQYAVTSYLAHPNYASNQAYDFAMVTFTWANNEPPVIPRATPAQDQALGPGSNMTFVGYGVTENNDFNSTRYYFNGKLADDDALSLYYNQSSMGSFANNGGPCFGDSGGPALLNVAGVGEVVVGVTSYGDQNCTQFGVSARVSAVDSWIADYIANGGGGSVQLTCDECSTEATSSGGTCEGPVDDCFTDSECSAFYDCLVACDGQPQSCVDQCVNDYPNGLETYLAIFTCLCNVGCTSECANEPMCEGPQGCGFTAEDPQCLSCLEGNCCSQGSACAADQDCKNCLTGANPDPNCINENVLAAQFYQCLAQKCGDECGIQGGGGGGQGGSGAGSGSGAGGGGVGAGGVGAGGGGVGPGGGGVGAGDVGGNGAGAGDEGGDDGSGGNNNDDDGNVSAVACTCRAAGGDAPNGNVAIALGAALAGLFASRRKRRVS